MITSKVNIALRVDGMVEMSVRVYMIVTTTVSTSKVTALIYKVHGMFYFILSKALSTTWKTARSI